MFKHACGIGLEGVVSKVRDSKYPTGRSNDWVKTTCAQRETLTIAGFAFDGSKWDGLYLGRRKGENLIYAGKVDHGFDKDSAKELQARLKPLIRKPSPTASASPIAAPGMSQSCWSRLRTAQSPPRAKCVIRSSRASVRICNRQGWHHACICGAAGMPCPQCNPSRPDHPPRPPADTHIDFDKKGWRH
jgi:hypothetical protein